MSGRSRRRDIELLDALDSMQRVSVRDTVWRVVRSERDPLLCRPSLGRWDRGHFDVLYTSFEPDGAIAEMYFHLSRQPVFPRTVAFTLNGIDVVTQNTLQFLRLHELEGLGVSAEEYGGLLLERTQEIGDAAAFLGFDGIIAPSARWDCLNLTLVCDHLHPDDLVLQDSRPVDWDDWREAHRTTEREGAQ
jgi:hypothetical protein